MAIITLHPQSLYIADLRDLTPRIVERIYHEWPTYFPSRPLTDDRLMHLFDWVITEGLSRALWQRSQGVRIVNHTRIDEYLCVYEPALQSLLDPMIGQWLIAQGLYFKPGTTLKVLVTYTQLLISRTLYPTDRPHDHYHDL